MMFEADLIPWLYEQLRATGYYDVDSLRFLERRPLNEARRMARGLFEALPSIEQNDIRHAYFARELDRITK